MNKSEIEISHQNGSSLNSAYERFIKSMQIGFYEWHEGIGYDLKALKELNGQEFTQVETLLISRKERGWRDVEALAALSTPDAIEALKECLKSKNNEVKLDALKYLKELNIEDHVEEIIVETLPGTKFFGGLTRALALIEKYPGERIKHVVLWCCLNGNDDIRVHCAAMALFLYGEAVKPFDGTHEIIYEFQSIDYQVRYTAFEQLCRQIGVDAENIIGDGSPLFFGVYRTAS